MKMRVKVNVSQWAWGDGDESHVLAGGTHSLPSDDVALSKDFVQAIAAAAAADPGSIEILSSDDAAKKAMSAGVESEADSLKALAKAQEDGSWHESNLEAQVALFDGVEAEAKANLEDELPGEWQGVIVRAQHGREQALAALAEIRGES